MRASKYNAALLAPLVQQSHTLAELLRRLGLRPTGGNYRNIARALRVANIDVSHFKRSSFETIDPAILADHVRTSRSIAQVLAKLGMPLVGRPHHSLSRYIRDTGLDTSHFQRNGWARGLTAATSASLDVGRKKRMLPDAVVFVENSPAVITGTNLSRRLIALGRPYRCDWCGIDRWRGQRLVLHLDHINGVNNDNRLSNLRFLCPNCHSQTPTYGNRRR